MDQVQFSRLWQAIQANLFAMSIGAISVHGFDTISWSTGTMDAMHLMKVFLCVQLTSRVLIITENSSEQYLQ